MEEIDMEELYRIIFKIIIIICLYGILLLLLWLFNVFPFENFIDLGFDNGLRHTKNMSYDLRGDPTIIPRMPMVWNNPNRYPIYNEGI
jgi:hypothetical protein